MKPSSALTVVIASILLLTPIMAFAHEGHVFQIGDKKYTIEVGSLNEPVVVDDKSGVEFIVALGEGHEEEESHDDANPNAVLGLDKTLKVEVSAGDKKKTLDLTPISDEPGGYKAVFIPTMQTTFTYRFFGTINNVPVDLSFTCNPAGHVVTEEETGPVKLSDKVTELSKEGAFGCPMAKADLGFPERAPTLLDLSQGSGNQTGMIALVLGALGLLAGIAAWMKASKR